MPRPTSLPRACCRQLGYYYPSCNGGSCNRRQLPPPEVRAGSWKFINPIDKIYKLISFKGTQSVLGLVSIWSKYWNIQYLPVKTAMRRSRVFGRGTHDEKYTEVWNVFLNHTRGAEIEKAKISCVQNTFSRVRCY